MGQWQRRTSVRVYYMDYDQKHWRIDKVNRSCLCVKIWTSWNLCAYQWSGCCFLCWTWNLFHGLYEVLYKVCYCIHVIYCVIRMLWYVTLKQLIDCLTLATVVPVSESTQVTLKQMTVWHWIRIHTVPVSEITQVKYVILCIWYIAWTLWCRGIWRTLVCLYCLGNYSSEDMFAVYILSRKLLYIGNYPCDMCVCCINVIYCMEWMLCLCEI